MVIQEKSNNRGKVMSNSRPEVFKIIIGGDGGIGKTTMLKVLCGQGFSNQDMTIGFEVYAKEIYINGHKDFLQIWDLSGQDHFRFLLPDYFKGAHGVILGFDMSRRSSFLNLRTWMSILMSKCPNASVILIATKADLGYHPTLNHIMAEDFVEKFKLIDFIEVSSKNNLNIERPFVTLVESMKGVSHGSINISFQTPETEETCAPIESSPPSETLEPIKEETPPTEAPTVEPLITKCPFCDHPLREVQSKLIQSGRMVLCQNCYKMVHSGLAQYK